MALSQSAARCGFTEKSATKTQLISQFFRFSLHTVSFDIFRSLSEYEFETFYFDEIRMLTYLYLILFVKSQSPF